MTAATRVYVDPVAPALDRAARSRDPDARRAWTSELRCAGSLALERVARAWALLEGRELRHPERRRAPLPARRRPPDRLHAGLRRGGARAALGGGDGVAPRAMPRAGAAPGRRPRRATSPPRPSASAPAAAHLSAEAEAAAGRASRTATIHSARRGTGSDVAGSRPYRRGDDVKAIDWPASAQALAGAGDGRVRRSRALRRRGAADRRSLRPPPFDVALPAGLAVAREAARDRAALRLIGDSALAVQGYVGYLDHGAGGDAVAAAAEPARRSTSSSSSGRFGAPADALERGLEELVRHRRDVPAGTFVFVVSDFLAAPPRALWLRVLARRWTSIPVVVQDPVWEQSFPDVGGIVIPFVDPASGQAALRGADAPPRRPSGGGRTRSAAPTSFARCAASTSSRCSSRRATCASVFSAFLAWADRRRRARGRAW